MYFGLQFHSEIFSEHDTLTIKVNFVLFHTIDSGNFQLFGAFLAWETRNVQIPALNDSKVPGKYVTNSSTLQ